MFISSTPTSPSPTPAPTPKPYCSTHYELKAYKYMKQIYTTLRYDTIRYDISKHSKNKATPYKDSHLVIHYRDFFLLKKGP